MSGYIEGCGSAFGEEDLGHVEKGAVNSRFDEYGFSRDETMGKIQRDMDDYTEFSFDESIHKKDKVIEELERFADSVIAKGIDFYFVVPPLMANSDYILKMKTYLERGGYKVIDMGSPEKHPDIYEVQNVRDIRHLNRDGAVLNTKNFFLEYQRLSTR